MAKRLEDMTLEELWELFPIVLVPHNPLWKAWADSEIAHLQELLSVFNPEINHIGSTAIPDIMAKPIVDLLVEVTADVEWQQVKDKMCGSGYICMAESASRIDFNKGYTPEGYAERVFHIHFHRTGDSDEILFRDYLAAHPGEAREYEKLKLSLLPKYRNDRDGYTAAKTTFIQHMTARSKTGKVQHAVPPPDFVSCRGRVSE